MLKIVKLEAKVLTGQRQRPIDDCTAGSGRKWRGRPEEERHGQRFATFHIRGKHFLLFYKIVIWRLGRDIRIRIRLVSVAYANTAYSSYVHGTNIAEKIYGLHHISSNIRIKNCFIKSHTRHTDFKHHRKCVLSSHRALSLTLTAEPTPQPTCTQLMCQWTSNQPALSGRRKPP